MKVVIAGCGRVGALLATRLSAAGHDVAVIDKDPHAFERLGKMFRGKTARGMVFDKDALEARRRLRGGHER
jgi:trk system potassium uptake protein TrkA